MVPLSFKLSSPFKEVFSHGEIVHNDVSSMVGLYGATPRPILMDADRYDRSVKAGRFLTRAEYDQSCEAA